MTLRQIPAAFAIVSLLTAPLLAADTPHATLAVASHPVLVELFTSEGCSSCPPADALLRKLQGEHTAAGQWIIGISEHVTYWNQLGWADPFSSESFTERQSNYGDRFGLASVYTPQVVVNGAQEVLGSDEAAILRAVRLTDRPTTVAVTIGSIMPSAGGVSVTFSVAGTSSAKSAEIYAVIADDMASSHVLRGENAGRTLAHVSVARELTRVASSTFPTTLTVTLPDPPRRPDLSAAGRHLILFAQKPGGGRVLAISTRPL